jgi:hypothetical protein
MSNYDGVTIIEEELDSPTSPVRVGVEEKMSILARLENE